MQFKNELTDIIVKDEQMISTLTRVKNLNLNDCWIGAGFVRNKVWDILHGQKTMKLNDIDVVFFDESNISENLEKKIEHQLTQISPEDNWSVKNQARMHFRNNHPKYINTENAISHWPETATAVSVRLNPNDQIEILAPYGLYDLFNLIVKPTPNFDLILFQKRVNEKQWKKQWENLKIYDNS
ncbi:nucleotidyltransferase family protein [Flavobacterium ginsenosidimutans]|uniref:Nucleotidyltransferase family protein n=1 Tax=Flavobacterium ginsenosidimutans TaxID=687844 RepID=A0ABZ2Q3M7_9FLAO